MDGKYTEGTLQFLDNVFGLKLSARPDISDAQKQLIAERGKAREAKDWTKSDILRAKLLDQSLEIRDTDHGQIWSRTG